MFTNKHLLVQMVFNLCIETTMCVNICSLAASHIRKLRCLIGLGLRVNAFDSTSTPQCFLPIENNWEKTENHPLSHQPFRSW